MSGLGRRPDGENWDEPKGTASGGSAGASEKQRAEGGGCGEPGGGELPAREAVVEAVSGGRGQGLRHRSAGRASARAKPARFRRRVIQLVREKYGEGEGEGFGPTLAAEHLGSEDGIVVSKLKCPLFRAHDMSGLSLRDRRRGCGKVGIPRCVRDFQAERKSLPLGFSSQRLFYSLSPAIQFALAQTRPSLRVLTADDMRPIANTPALVQMLADRDRASGQSSPPARRFDLQNLSSH